MNRSKYRKFGSSRLIFLLLFAWSLSTSLQAQVDEFVKGKKYTIDSIRVTGLKTFNDQTVISYSGLRRGQVLQLPGEEISGMINKLWKLELFSDINFYLTHIQGDKATLEIQIEELPSLSDVKIQGVKKERQISLSRTPN